MRIRTVLTAAILAALAAVPLAGVASAQPAATHRDCRDFASQAAAQSALRSHSGDPARLDPDHNGVACEDFFRTAGPGPAAVAPVPPVPPAPPAPVAPPVAVVPPPGAPVEAPLKTGAPADAVVRTVPEHQILVPPHGPADTGDGSTAPVHETPVLLLAAGLGAVAVLGGRRLVSR
jgi:Excalibur calcium-binding domain